MKIVLNSTEEKDMYFIIEGYLAYTQYCESNNMNVDVKAHKLAQTLKAEMEDEFSRQQQEMEVWR